MPSMYRLFGSCSSNGPGPAAGRDHEGLVDHARQFAHVLHEVVPLRTRPRDARDVGFLEGVVADHLGRDLPREDNDRDRIELGGGERGDGVGRAGAGGDNADAGSSRRAGLAGVAAVWVALLCKVLMIRFLSSGQPANLALNEVVSRIIAKSSGFTVETGRSRQAGWAGAPKCGEPT